MRVFAKTVLSVIFLALSAPYAVSQDAAKAETEQPEQIIFPGENIDLDEFIWVKRPLIVFADSPNDPRFIQQMEYIEERIDALAERDVIVVTDTARSTANALRRKFRPRGFMLVLVGKDGTIYLRKPFPWSVREISRSIDKLPLRQQENQDRRRTTN